MINWKGQPSGVQEIVMGKVVKDLCHCSSVLNDQILVTEASPFPVKRCTAVISVGHETAMWSSCFKGPVLSLKDVSADDFEEGDIVALYPEGICILLYRTEWHDVTLFFTNQCNSRCIMCPQISYEDSGNFLDMNKKLLQLGPEEVEHIGITGGEPTVYPKDLEKLLTFAHHVYPEVSLSLLTNGRAFHDAEFVKRLVSIGHKRFMFCIPLYAANYEQHDAITGIPHSFQETIEGIYNLYRYHQLIEIRIVIFKYNASYLEEFVHFIYRNMPFVRHVAFMGMEYVGRAADKKEQFWIDPFNYKSNLNHAVWYLHQRGMNVSIYNIPFCLLENQSYHFARDSISSWKKAYERECSICKERGSCSGEFATSSCKSSHIHPFI